jgi:hypothetical protein
MERNYGQRNDGLPRTAVPWTGPQPHDAGVTHGLQALFEWEPGDNDVKPVADARLADHMWRVSIIGAVKLRLVYGTKANLELDGLETPLVMNIPGQLAFYAEPLDQTDERTDTVECRVTLTPVTQGCCQTARQLLSNTSLNPLTLDPASSFFTLESSELNIRSVDVTVPAFTRVPLISGSFLISGVGFAEYEP